MMILIAWLLDYGFHCQVAVGSVVVYVYGLDLYCVGLIVRIRLMVGCYWVPVCTLISRSV